MKKEYEWKIDRVLIKARGALAVNKYNNSQKSGSTRCFLLTLIF